MAISAETIKQEILSEIEKLPEQKLPEVLDFVSFLLFKEGSHASPLPKQTTELNPQDNPLLQFIGAVSHGALAQDIDEELYGQ
jgi:hypothetical protein